MVKLILAIVAGIHSRKTCKQTNGFQGCYSSKHVLTFMSTKLRLLNVKVKQFLLVTYLINKN